MRNIIEGVLIVSAQASIMVLTVLILRIFIKKTYKVFTYFMWLAILLRLCVPIQMESPFGIIETKEKIVVETPVDNPEYNYDVQDDLGIQNNTVTVTPEVKPEVKPSITPQAKPNTAPDTTSSVSESDKPEVTKTKLALTKEQIVLIVWLMGAMVVATLAAVQVIMLRRRVRFAIHIEGNIWETDNINTAFVIGIFRPRIYIPASLNKKERDHILMHERMHIRHGDNIVRVVMLLVNVFYWWNPLVWVAVHLMKKDMEMFCDESVIKKMDGATQGAYLRTLLNCSAKNSGIIPVMSFGETNTEVRIRHIMNLKRPKIYIFMVLVVFGIISVVGCVRVARPYEETTTEPITKETENTTDKVESGEQQSAEAEEKPTEQIIEEELYGVYSNEDETNFVLIDSYYVSFWDETLYGDSSSVEYDMNGIFFNCEYYKYKICENKIKLIDVDTREETPFEIEIIGNTVIKYLDEEYKFSNKLADSYLMNSTGYPQYDEIINKVVDVNMDGTGDLWSKLEEQNICKLLASSSVLKQCGFYLIDLDGDGIEEMLLGENGEGAYDGIVYEIYSIKDGELIKVCEGGERESYYLCSDNIIYRTGSSGASNTNYEFYEYKNGKLVAKTIVIYYGTLDSDDGWYLCDESLDYRTGTPISEAEAEALINMYTYIPIEFTPFAIPEF